MAALDVRVLTVHTFS